MRTRQTENQILETLEFDAWAASIEAEENEEFLRMRYDEELNFTLDMLDRIADSARRFTHEFTKRVKEVKQSERN